MVDRIPSKLKSFIEVAPYIIKVHSNDIAIAISDLEKYLDYFPGKEIIFPGKLGDMVKEETILYQAMKENKVISKKMGKELYGFPYIATATPIVEKGQVIGGVVFLESIKKQDQFMQMAEVLYTGIAELQIAAQQISAVAEDLNKHKNTYNYNY